MHVQAKNILLLCSSPLLSLRICMYVDLMEGVTLHSFSALEGALLDKKSDIDLVIAVSQLGNFDDTARVQRIRKEWPGRKIVLITELLLSSQRIYTRKVVNEVVYLFWFFQSKQDLQKLIEGQLIPELTVPAPKTVRKVQLSTPKPRSAFDRLKPAIIVIASSTGGFAALRKLIGTLPDAFRTPMIIVQHIPRGFDTTLQRSLSTLSKCSIVLAKNGPIQKRHIYIAPHDHHVEVYQESGTLCLRVTQSDPVHSLRPAADPLFYSAASLINMRVVAAILTGMGSDGTEGGKALRQAGAQIICQDEASSSVWGMARTAVEAGICDRQVALNDMAATLFDLTK